MGKDTPITVQLTFQGALDLIKSYIETGNTDNALILIDQLTTPELEEPRQDSLTKKQAIVLMDLLINGLQKAPSAFVGGINWPALRNDAERIKHFIEKRTI